MSDEGITGGELYQVAASGGEPRSLTPNTKSSVADFTWPKDSKYIVMTEALEGGSAVTQLDPATGETERLWKGGETILSIDGAGVSVSADGKSSTVLRSSWERPPAVFLGGLGDWHKITHANDDRIPLWGEAKSIAWKSDGFDVQGWLLYPRNYDATKKYPMVVSVHGGPASSMKPSWPRPGFNATLLSQQGYFVLLPNPRGSYGQGEKFTAANVKDFGGGDLRDILAGVDEALRIAPIDANRLGITGWSYGGYHDHVGRHPNQPLSRGRHRRRHRQLAELLRARTPSISGCSRISASSVYRRPRRLRQKLAHHLHQERQNPHPRRGRRPRCRVPYAPVF